MQKEQCTVCGKSKSLLNCGICAVSVCKHCAQILDEDTFSFLDTKKSEIQHSVYCNICFDKHVLPELTSYNETMEAAKEVAIFFKDQGKETRLIKKVDIVLSVIDCADENETLMRLAFKAVRLGFNAVIGVDLITKKVLAGTYKKHIFNATGIPANVRPDNIVKDRSIWHHPN